MGGDRLVLDANVLIGFYNSNWFANLSFWRPEYELLTPESIWKEEFVPNRNIQQPPDWLSVVQVEEEVTRSQPGQLSQYDWLCLSLARNRDGILITSDGPLKHKAGQYGITTKWSGSFLLDTFRKCGISVEDYDEGIEEFITDSYLPTEACDELRAAEKL